jgi:acyltransferase
VASSHGNLLLFPLTALFGFFFLVFLSQTTPANRALLFVGRNSLALLGLNGIFYHFLNLPIASRLNTWIPPSPWALGLAALTVSLLSIAACAPVILLLNARFPLLVGKRPSQPSLASLAGEEVSLTDF